MHVESKNVNQPGTVPAWFFDKHGFTLDKDTDGNVVRRDFDLSAEWRWRNSILTNPHLVLTRRQWKRDRVVKQNEKVMECLRAKNQILADARTAIEKRAAALDKPLHEWTFPEFFGLRVVDMKNFCKARTPGVVQAWKGSINKGKVDADEDADTLARIAWRMRLKEPVGQVLTLEDLGLQLTDADKERTLIKLPTLVDVSQFVGPLEHLSEIVSENTKVWSEDARWMTAVQKHLIGFNIKHVSAHPASDLLLDVKRVTTVLQQRLQLHLRSRLVGKIVTLRSHWVWRFFAANTSRMAAIVVWFGHTLSGMNIEYAAASGLQCLYAGDNLTSRCLPDTEPE